MGLWTGCVAGALIAETYRAKLEAAGFEHVGIEPTRIFETDDIAAMAGDLAVELPEGLDADAIIGELGGSIMSAFVRAQKPTPT
jgi:hypothetical protein